MAEGLRVAFGPGDAAPPPSVLRFLQQKTASRLDLHLHDGSEEPSAAAPIDEEAEVALRDPAGRYQMLGEIGRGGVGIVYKGRDQDLGRDVAMKVLRPELAARPEILERFVEEAQIGGQLQHPGIVPVYELGLHDGERPYFAMKLVKGETLAALLARRKDASEDRLKLLGIFEQICQTIAFAHARRVVHRDLKPMNVMLGSFGEVHVVDWGCAKVLQERARPNAPVHARSFKLSSVISTVRSHPERGSQSVAGSMFGTPAYMPPEQALGDVEHLDQRSDVFGLGAILCEILTGSPPYRAQEGDLIQQAARADLGLSYERIERSGADDALVKLCKQCLSPARAARPESARQVANAVSAHLTSVEERARRAQIHAAEAKVRTRATLLLSAAAVLLFAFGGGGYSYVQQEARTRRDQADRCVAEALEEANLRLGEARAADASDLTPWDRAADAAVRIEHLTADTDVGAAQRDGARTLLAILHAERARAIAAANQLAKDEAMRGRLLEVRIPDDEDHDPKGQKLREALRRTEAYTAAFLEHLEGRDLGAMSVEAGVSALAGPMAMEHATALDHWVFARRILARARHAEAQDLELTLRLQHIACALDDDAWRNRLRALSARSEPDREALVRLLAETNLRGLPAVSSSLLGHALWDAGELDAARTVYGTACERHPQDFDCAFSLGLLSAETERHEEAVAYFRIARALRPELREVRHRLGMAFNVLDDGEADEQIFRALAREEPENAHWQFHLALRCASDQRLEEAVALYRRSIELDGTFGAAHSNLGIELRKLDRLEEACVAFRRAIELDPSHALSYRELGDALMKLRRVDESVSILRRAVELSPPDARDPYNLGIALERQGHHTEAGVCYRQAIELKPDFALAHGALGQVLLTEKRFDEAATSLRRALELDESLAFAHRELALVLVMRGLLDDALPHARRAVALAPEDAGNHFQLGVVLGERGQAAASAACYRRAIELDPERVEPLLNLGVYFARLGQHDEAISCYRRALEVAPSSAEAHQGLGITLAHVDELDESAACIERSIELDPRSAKAHQTLGTVLHLQDRGAEAVAAFRRVLAIEPEEPTAFFGLSSSLYEMDQMELALEALQRAEAIWSRAQDASGREWHRIAERNIEFLESRRERLPESLALLHGDEDSASAEAFSEAAALGYRRGEYLAAACVFVRAFATYPELSTVRYCRYGAARCAALAGSGQGAGAAELDEAERAHWREQSRLWLDAEIERWRIELVPGAAGRRLAKQWLSKVRHTHAFDAMRGEAALETLPAAEAELWRSTWTRFAELQAEGSRK